jgi:3-oxoacyl-[acyl-carrier-protein] synthase III
MAPLQTNQATVSQDMVTRVGSAAGRVARIQQDYAMEAEAETATEAREALASRARAAAERAIDEQGISIQDYNAVLSAAETDQDLEQRLLDAAREVL